MAPSTALAFLALGLALLARRAWGGARTPASESRPRQLTKRVREVLDGPI